MGEARSRLLRRQSPVDGRGSPARLRKDAIPRLILPQTSPYLLPRDSLRITNYALRITHYLCHHRLPRDSLPTASRPAVDSNDLSNRETSLSRPFNLNAA